MAGELIGFAQDFKKRSAPGWRSRSHPSNGTQRSIPPADKPSIFTALQDQLGLKLEPERGLGGVVVIDHIERPTED